MIRFQNVSKFFGEDRPALADVSFSIQPGEFVLLTGPSGSGKSTLLKLITQEYLPTEGDIEFDSQLLSEMRRSQIFKHRRQIGMVYQDYRLLPEMNVWENIALPLEIIGKSSDEIAERITDLLELVGLTDKAYHFPSQLSGGEAQRVGIARALGTAPKVLLADEPTGNLDPESTMMISKLFDKIHELGTTILLATHDLSILSQTKHRRIHLEKGALSSDIPGRKGSERSKISHKQTEEEAPKQAQASPTPDPIVETKPPKGWKVSFPWNRKKTPTKEELAAGKEVNPADTEPAHHHQSKKDQPRPTDDKDVLVKIEEI